MLHRSFQSRIEKDLSKKIVFLTGPRQVGKTWLAKEIARTVSHSLYLNYDSPEDRRIIENASWLPKTRLVILDELHKMHHFKNYLKGLYDTHEGLQLLVTGSARLDAFRQMGDSLAGRYFLYRLLPLSLSELRSTEYCDLERLLERGGFPEPFLASEEDARRWRMFYLDGLIRNDVLQFENVHDLKSMQLLFELLQTKVGSPISYSSLARDLNISPNTVKRYIDIFEALFLVFRVRPYHEKIARAIRKEPKLYFFDTGLLRDDPARNLENLVALSLLKNCYSLSDTQGILYELCYVRTKDGAEVDFLITKEHEPQELIEVKSAETKIHPALRKIQKMLSVRAVQLVLYLKHESRYEGVELRRVKDYLTGLDF